MAQEIERKFLVLPSIQDHLKDVRPKRICQGYIMDAQDGRTVRVRTKGSKGFLTIKGPSKGISRNEFEYEIPLSEAETLLTDFCPKTLLKDRFELIYADKTWEIDVFHGHLKGLIVAEIELENVDETFALPDWIGKEVSDDERYYNVQLINAVGIPA